MSKRQPHIDLSDDDAAKLRKAGFSRMTVYFWRSKRMGPTYRMLQKINATLGRDVLQPAPVAGPPSPETKRQPTVSERQTDISHRHIEINPCVDDSVCLAVRNAAMWPVANTLLDQKRTIPCMNCPEGIRRARAEAAKKVAHVGALICSCGEEKSRDARTCHACASERKRSFRPQPLRGARRATP